MDFTNVLGNAHSIKESAECYPELFKLCVSQPQQADLAESIYCPQKNIRKIGVRESLPTRVRADPIKRRGRPKKQRISMGSQQRQQERAETCYNYADDSQSDVFISVSSPASVTCSSKSSETGSRNNERKYTPKATKPTPRNVMNIHGTLLGALCSYTMRRAHIPRELKELAHKKRPCVSDMTAILNYQEQMNILLRSEYYFLQRIEQEYGSITAYCDNGIGVVTYSANDSDSRWSMDLIPKLDDLITASEKALQGD